jgi:hypothetical protein
VVAAHSDDGGVPQAAALENGEVCRPTADVEKRDTKFFFVGREHCFGRGQLADDRVSHLHARAVDAGDQILRRRRAAGHDVDVDLQSSAGETNRCADAFLLINYEVLRKHV